MDTTTAAAGNGRLRIALLSYRSKPHCGGQGVYIRHLSRELAALGHDVEVFSGQPYPELDEGVKLTKVPSEISPSITCHSCFGCRISFFTRSTIFIGQLHSLGSA